MIFPVPDKFSGKLKTTEKKQLSVQNAKVTTLNWSALLVKPQTGLALFLLFFLEIMLWLLTRSIIVLIAETNLQIVMKQTLLLNIFWCNFSSNKSNVAFLKGVF